MSVVDSIIEVHGLQKQHIGFSHFEGHGIKALPTTLSTAISAPVIVAQLLRKTASTTVAFGSIGSDRG